MEYHGVCNDILTTSSVFYPSHHHSSVMTGCSGHQLISSFHFSFVSKISIVFSHLQLHQSFIKITVRSHRYYILWDEMGSLSWKSSWDVTVTCVVSSVWSDVWGLESSWSSLILTPGWLQLSGLQWLQLWESEIQPSDLTPSVLSFDQLITYQSGRILLVKTSSATWLQ